MSSLLAVNTVIIIPRVPDSVGNNDICEPWHWREGVRIQHAILAEPLRSPQESMSHRDAQELKKFRTEGTYSSDTIHGFFGVATFLPGRFLPPSV